MWSSREFLKKIKEKKFKKKEKKIFFKFNKKIYIYI